jgi:hypothetical protein
MRRFATTFLLGAVLISVGLALVILLVVATQEGTQDAAIRQLREENRIQDAHNVNSARALMRAAQRDLEAGRGEHARILATAAMATMIGLHHQPCGGPQALSVPGVHVPGPLRSLFGEDGAYTIAGSVGTGAEEMLQVRITAAVTC